MRTLTATEASRGFKALLDSVERGHEEITITRGGHPIAKISPMRTRTWAQIRDGLAKVAIPGDDSLESEITAARNLLTGPEDPWTAS